VVKPGARAIDDADLRAQVWEPKPGFVLLRNGWSVPASRYLSCKLS